MTENDDSVDGNKHSKSEFEGALLPRKAQEQMNLGDWNARATRIFHESLWKSKQNRCASMSLHDASEWLSWLNAKHLQLIHEFKLHLNLSVYALTRRNNGTH